MAYVINYATQHIDITSPQTDVDIQDLIDFIRGEEATQIGISYPKIAEASGKESLGGGVSVGITINILGPWQLHFWEGAYIAKVSGGNLVGGPGGDPIAYSAGVQVLLIQSAASTIVDLTETDDILKLTGNNVVKSGDTITIYEDDGVTIWRQYDLSDGGRIKL